MKSITPCIISDYDNPRIIFPSIRRAPEKTRLFTDTLGTGKQLICEVDYEGIAAKVIFKIYDSFDVETYLEKYPIVTVQIFLESNSSEIELLGYLPVYSRTLPIIENKMVEKENLAFYGNGWQSWSENFVLDYKSKTPNLPIKIYRKMMINQDEEIKARYQSEMHTIIHDKKSRKSIILGFLTHQDQFTRVLMNTEPNISLYAYSQTDGIPIHRLNEGLLRSELAFITLVSQPEEYEMLTFISYLTGKLAGYIPRTKVFSGFCSWYYYYTKINQEELISNINFFEKHREIPIDLIQLDDGYQTCIGDWGIEDNTFNDKFPGGMQWLSNKIKNAGFESGIWIAPFLTTKKAQLYKNHQNWTLRDTKGEIGIMKNWGAMQYGLDTSNDEVVKYLQSMSRVITNEWKFDYIKIDFLFASAPLHAIYSRDVSRAQAIRLGVQAIRDGMGDAFLLGCGAPLGPCIGLVDAMRIGSDTAATWSHLEWIVKKVSNLEYPALKPALRATIQRSYMHNTLWINDPDCVIVRENKSKLSLDEVILQLTIFGLNGGQVFVSDDEQLVSEDRLELLKRILPPYGVEFGGQFLHPIPLDFMNSKFPHLYGRDIQTCFGLKHLIAIINWGRRKSFKFPLQDLIRFNHRNYYSSTQTFAVFDYWKEELLGFYHLDDIIELNVPKHGCRYLVISPVEGFTFLSSSFHIIPGEPAIKSCNFEDNTLIINFNEIGARDGKLFFYDDSRTINRTINCESVTRDNLHIVSCENTKIIEIILHEERLEAEDSV